MDHLRHHLGHLKVLRHFSKTSVRECQTIRSHVLCSNYLFSHPEDVAGGEGHVGGGAALDCTDIVNYFNIGTSIPGWGISWSIWPDSYRWTQPTQRGGWVEVVHKVQPLLPVFFSPALALLGSTPEFGINDQILDLKTYGFWENFSPVCTPCWRGQIPQQGSWWGLSCIIQLVWVVIWKWWATSHWENLPDVDSSGSIFLPNRAASFDTAILYFWSNLKRTFKWKWKYVNLKVKVFQAHFWHFL